MNPMKGGISYSLLTQAAACRMATARAFLLFLSTAER
jgi:hypothetical protein